MTRDREADGERRRALLTRLYRHRFSADDRRALAGVWQVLVQDFFQPRVGEDGTVVDLGAGACFFINGIRARRRIALDADPEVLSQAGPGVTAIVIRDLSLGELADGSVDHVFVSNFLEHLPDYVTALELMATVHRKLKPGGSLMILQPNFRLAPGRYFDFIDHTLILTERSLVEALEVAGFEIAELRTRFLPFTSKGRLPTWRWAVRVYLHLPPIQWLMGKQTFVRARKPAPAGAS
jgi:SAM-dependent methyltransferase